jgi:hypothetical protein
MGVGRGNVLSALFCAGTVREHGRQYRQDRKIDFGERRVRARRSSAASSYSFNASEAGDGGIARRQLGLGSELHNGAVARWNDVTCRVRYRILRGIQQRTRWFCQRYDQRQSPLLYPDLDGYHKAKLVRAGDVRGLVVADARSFHRPNSFGVPIFGYQRLK